MPSPQVKQKPLHYATGRLTGTRTAKGPKLEDISGRLVSKLNLQFTPEDWQLRVIRSILLGFDTIFCAGTGYGKSLIFEGLAVWQQKKIIIVICPLKALEEDQASTHVEVLF